MIMTTLTPQENKLIDEYWNEHDGTHFYKDELKELVVEIKHNATIQGARKYRDALSRGASLEMGYTNEDVLFLKEVNKI